MTLTKEGSDDLYVSQIYLSVVGLGSRTARFGCGDSFRLVEGKNKLATSKCFFTHGR